MQFRDEELTRNIDAAVDYGQTVVELIAQNSTHDREAAKALVGLSMLVAGAAFLRQILNTPMDDDPGRYAADHYRRMLSERGA